MTAREKLLNRERMRRWEERHPGVSRARKRRWVLEHPEKRKAAITKYISRFPHKRAAHVAVGNAIRDGKLIRPSACECCGTICTPEAHHEDYSLVLEVQWLCNPCHKIADKERKEKP